MRKLNFNRFIAIILTLTIFTQQPTFVVSAMDIGLTAYSDEQGEAGIQSEDPYENRANYDPDAISNENSNLEVSDEDEGIPDNTGDSIEDQLPEDGIEGEESDQTDSSVENEFPNKGEDGSEPVVNNETPYENTIDLSGRIIYMGFDNATFEQINLILYVNGTANHEIIPAFEPEEAEFPTWRYSFTGLPEKDEQGGLYAYAVKAESPSDGKGRLFYRMNGEIVGSGEVSAWAELDLVYVRLRDVAGAYRVEGEDNYLPEGVVLSADTIDAEDSRFCPGSADVSLENARWRLQKCPRYNPLTGSEIEYRIQVSENAEDYQAEYQNPAPNEQEQEYVFADGMIVNRYTGKARQGEPEEIPEEAGQPTPIQPLSALLQNTLSAEESGFFTVRVNWNDNNNARNDRPDSLSLTLYYQTPDMTEPAELTPDILEFWDVDLSSIGPSVDKVTEYNYWTYRYSLPEKLVIYGGDNGELISESPLTYSFTIRDKAVLEEYYGVEYGGDGKSVICTQNTTFSIDKVWKDSSNRYGTRPAQSELSSKLTLFRSYTTQYLQTVIEEVGVLSELSQVEIDASSDVWSIRITDLPEYDAAGNMYIYYIKETNDMINVTSGNTLDNSGGVKYLASYNNEGNYTDRKTGCYENGSIVNTLTDTVIFSGKKQWQDDGEQIRPEGKLYLYRYPKIEGRDYTTASPVSGMELALDTSTNYYIIDFSGLPGYPSGGLPRFDDEGNEYVYFVQEITSGGSAGNYTRFYDYGSKSSPDSGAANALFNGGTLQNRRTGTISLPVTKTWKAAARQDMDASVTLMVERRLKGTSDSFVPVNEIGAGGEYELSGFRAEVMELSHVFAGLPRFDTEGLEYEYRVTEKAVTINGERMDLSAVSSVGGTKTCITNDGYTFEMSESVGFDGAVTLTNRLVGKTEVRVRKIWNGINDTDSLPPVAVNIYRDGAYVATGTINPVNAWVQNSGVSDRGGQWFVSAYDRYDEDGREYRYTVVEAGIAGYQTTYSTSRAQEEKDGVNIGVVTTSVTNTPAGEGKQVVITKQWYDDGDETCRGPVTVALYHTGDGGRNWAPVSTGTLNAGNDWTVWLSLKSSDLYYENYYVRELGATRSGVMYNIDTAGIGDYPALTANSANPEKIGALKTDAHFYNCYAYASTDKSSYTFRNIRTGTVDIHLEKEWIDSGYHIGQVRQEITIEILRRLNYTAQEVAIQTVKLDGTVDSVETSSWNASFIGLPKYDEQGVLYHYRADETQVIELSGSNAGDSHTVAGGYTLTDGHRYSTGVNENRIYGEHNSGQTGPAADNFIFRINNMRSDTVDFKVYKVWKDIIRTGETRSRPDIYLTIYKTIGGVTTEVTPYVERVWTTTGGFNNYYWQCSFNPLPRYTSGGEEIIYSAREVMPFPGEYETSYYNASPVPVASPALAAIAPGITICDVPVGAQSGNGSVLNGGTIVNIRKAQRYLTGQKVWENVPAGISGDDLPGITLQLQIYEYNDVAAEFEYNNVIGYATVNLTSGKQNFVFNRQDNGSGASPYLPMYDEYGTFIIYRAAEVSGHTPGYLAPVYDDYNLTVKNVYNISAPDTVKVTVTKLWANVPDGIDAALYPTASVELWRCMVDKFGADRIATAEKVDTKTIKYPGTGPVEFTGLTKYGYNGRPYRYYIKESLNGYAVTISNDMNPTGLLAVTDGEYDKTIFEYEVTNAYTGISGQYIRLSGQKVWTDSGNAYGTRPADIVLRVWRATEGVDYSAVEITDSVDIVWIKVGNTWSYLVTAKQGGQVTDVGNYNANGNTLYRYAYNGNPYVYYVEEQNPNHHYTSTARTGTKVTEIRIAGQPDSYLTSDVNTVVKSVADSAGNTDASFTNTLVTAGCAAGKSWLKKEAAGSVPLTPAEFSMMLPDNVTFQVQYYDGNNWKPYPNDTSPVTTTLNKAQCIAALTNSGTMTVTFSGLPKFGANAADTMQYRVIETAISGRSISGMTGGYEVSDNPGVSIKNTLETIPLTIKKTWDDENNQDGVRPVIIIFSIVRDSDAQSAIPVTLNDTEWSTGKTVYVPKYKADGVTESVYTVEELMTNGQKADYSLKNAAPGIYTLTDPGTPGYKEFEFTNTHSAREINIAVVKSWSDATIDTSIGSANRDNIRPASVTVTLQRRDDSTGTWNTIPDSALASGETATVELNTNNNWTYTWTGLQSRHNSGGMNSTMKRYQFRVVEAPVNGYTAKYSLTSAFGTAVTVVDDQNCDINNNVKINIRNDLDATSLAVEKIWENNSGEFTAVAPVTVRLMYRKSGEPAWKEGATALTLASPSWKGTFANLPLKAGDGTAYEYSVKETMVGGDPVGADGLAFSYSNAVTGGKATNTLVTRSNIAVIKVWDDGGNRDGVRPSFVTVKLVKDKGTPEEKESVPVTLSETNSWSHTWTNLPKYRRDGSACVYTVEEITPPAGYTSTYSLDGGGYQPACENITEDLAVQDMETRTVRIKNSYAPKTMNLTVTKQWEDDDDRFGIRPDTIKIQLMFTTNPDGKTGVEAYGGTITLDSSLWRHTWSNLPIMKDGRKIYYSVVELRADGSQNAIPVQGYQSPAFDYAPTGSNGTVVTDLGNEVAIAGDLRDPDGMEHTVTVTNALDTVELTVEKEWIDYNNLYGSRPAALVFTLQSMPEDGALYQNVVDKSGVVTKEILQTQSPQTIVFVGLPKYGANGIEYRYRAVETGYKTANDVSAVNPDPKNFETGTFSLNNFQYDFIASTQAVAGGYKTSATNTLWVERIAFSGTKTWDDGQNRYLSRPNGLEIKLFYKKASDAGWTEFPAGSYSVSWIRNEITGKWFYTVSNLPRYVSGTTDAWQYSIVETLPEFYEQTAPIGVSNVTGTPNPTTGNITGADLTNALKTGAVLSVTKVKDRGPDSIEFEFTVYVSSREINASNPGIAYKGGYKVFTHNDNITTATPAAVGYTADGKIKIKSNQKFVLSALPPGYYYRLAETKHDEYVPDESGSSNLTGRLDLEANTAVEAIAANLSVTELAIENKTVNHDTGASAGLTNAGGKVAIVDQSDSPDKYDVDGYKRDRKAVVWIPETYWLLGDYYTIYYTEFGETQEKALTVSNYLDGNGNLKPFDQCCFDNPIEADRFIKAGASLSLTGDGAVMLILAAGVNDMPRKTRVEIQFIPTLSVSNVTNQHAGIGGTVMVNNGQEDPIADGVPDFGGIPYRANWVIGLAGTGYRVDDGKITIRNMNDQGGDSALLSIQTGGSFSALLPTTIAGNTAAVEVTGFVEYRKDSSGNIIEVKVVFDDLPVPLQVDIEFEGIPDSKPGGNSSGGFIIRHPEMGSSANSPSSPESGNSATQANTSDVLNSGDPKTGDNTPITAVAVLGLLTAVGAISLRKKKLNEVDDQ